MRLLFIIMSVTMVGWLDGVVGVINWFIGFLTLVYVLGKSNAKDLTMDQVFNPGWRVFAKREVECDE